MALREVPLREVPLREVPLREVPPREVPPREVPPRETDVTTTGAGLISVVWRRPRCAAAGSRLESRSVRLALAVVLLCSFVAPAQDVPTAPPIFATPEEQPPVPVEAARPARTPLPAGPPPAAVQPQPPPPDEPYVAPTSWQRCFAVPAQAWVAHPTSGRYYLYGSHHLPLSGPVSSAPAAGASGSNFHAATPVGQAPPRGGSSSGGSAGGVGDLGKAVLILAVVAVAILPIIIYALDSDAPPVVDQRFHCPSFGLDLYGGVDLAASVGGVAGTGTGRLNFGYSYFGTDFEFTYSGTSITAWAGHLLLRIGPKNHIEPNLAFGYRSLALRGAVRHGLEVGVPHRYVFWRENLRQFALELRPTFTFGLGTFDVGLEGALVIPIVEPVHVRAGGRVQSFGDEVIGGVNLGLSFHL